MELDTMMDNMANELNATLKAMGKAKSAEEKVQYSQAVKNLADSFAALLSAAGEIMPFDEDEMED